VSSTQTCHEDNDLQLQRPKDLEPELEPTLGQIFLAGTGCGLASTYANPPLVPSNQHSLDVLLPRRPAPVTNVGSPAPKNAFMDALKSVSHHKLTQNGAPAFSSTLSSTLDAFQSLSADLAAARIDALLTKSWAEDPALTLKVIWNTRSIHDGKGDKELFYRCVCPGRVCYQFLLTRHP
jgi:Domain of unknown function (DUF2828)